LLSVAGADASTGFPSPSFSSDMRSAPAPRLGFNPGRRRRDWRDATQLDERRPAIIGECMERGEPNALMLAGWNPAENDSASRHAPSSSAAAASRDETLCCIPTNSAGGHKKRKKQNCPWNFSSTRRTRENASRIFFLSGKGRWVHGGRGGGSGGAHEAGRRYRCPVELDLPDYQRGSFTKTLNPQHSYYQTQTLNPKP
jgi:hypothetical protein